MTLKTKQVKISASDILALPESQRRQVHQHLQEQIAATNALEKLACEHSFYYFVKVCFNILNPTTTLVTNWHIEYLCHIVQDEFERIQRKETKTHKAVVINVPPRSLKSEICSIIFPVWAWVRDPSFNIITSSHTLSLSETFARKSIALVNSEFIQELWGDKLKLAKENQNESVTTVGGTRKATATDAKIIGYGGDIIIVDDPQDPKSANSSADRQTAIRYYRESLMSRLNTPDVGIIITIMQRLHVEDQTGWLLDNDTDNRILHVCLPAIKTKDVKIPKLDKFTFSDDHNLKKTPPYKNEHQLLFPKRFTHQYLQDARTEFGSIAFAGQFLQSPIAGDGNLIKPDSLSIIGREGYTSKVVMLKHRPVINFIVDSASSNNKKSDFSAYCAYTFFQNTVYILDITRERVDPAYLQHRIERYARTHGYSSRSIIKIEPRSSGHTVASLIRKNSNLNVTMLKYNNKSGISNKSSKIERVNAIIAAIESGRIVLVSGNYIHDFKQEAAEFPYGKYDDMVDVFTMACLDALFYGAASAQRGITIKN
jgi:predicted phage terminase large subunit-like protein